MNREIVVCLTPEAFTKSTLQRAVQKAQSESSLLRIILVESGADFIKKMLNSSRIRQNMLYLDSMKIPVDVVNKYRLIRFLQSIMPVSNITNIYLNRQLCVPLNPLQSNTLLEELKSRFPGIAIQALLTNKTATLYEGDQEEASWIDNGIKMVLVILITTFVGLLFTALGAEEGAIMPIYMLGILICSLITGSWQITLISSLFSLVMYNYFFAEPRLSFLAYDPHYPITLFVMLISSLICGYLAIRLQKQNTQSQSLTNQQTVLLQANQSLQKAGSSKAVEKITLEQLNLLLGWQAIMFSRQQDHTFSRTFISSQGKNLASLLSDSDRDALYWVWMNQKIAGFETDHYASSSFIFFPVYTNKKIYAVAGLYVESNSVSKAQREIVQALLTESALAMENIETTQAVQQASMNLKEEKNRANLLRAISHDLRTPITSILGNATNLFHEEESFDSPTKKRMYQDMIDNSNWLISLVENLLSASRMENGKMEIHSSDDVMEELVEEAVSVARRNHPQKEIQIEHHDDLLMAKVDSKMIMQVLHNLIENAIVHTQPESKILIETDRRNGSILISISDDGPGISPTDVPHIFEMFYTGSLLADSTRSMGLGLYLCKQIIQAHSGKIWYEPNKPKGSRFCFTLPESDLIF